jgi:hypothetical protein
MDVEEITYEAVDWIQLIQDRDKLGGGALVNTVMSLRVP